MPFIINSLLFQSPVLLGSLIELVPGLVDGEIDCFIIALVVLAVVVILLLAANTVIESLSSL